MKKRLYERRSKKRDILILIINCVFAYLFLSWDFIFGDVFALAPGYMLTLIYMLPKSGYLAIIISAVYAFLWSVYHPSFIWLAPVFFLAFTIIALVYSHKRKGLRRFYFLFYILQFVFCLWFYNQFQLPSTQLIQVVLYLIVLLHVKVRFD